MMAGRMSLARSIPFFLIAWCATPALAQDPASPTWEFLATKYDADHDGRVSRAEYPRGDAPFARLDQDGDGAITPADFAARGGPDPAERRAMI